MPTIIASIVFSAALSVVVAVWAVPSLGFAESRPERSPSPSVPSLLFGIVERGGVLVPLGEYSNDAWSFDPDPTGYEANRAKKPRKVWTGTFSEIRSWTLAGNGSEITTSSTVVEAGCSGASNMGLLLSNRTSVDKEEQPECQSSMGIAYTTNGLEWDQLDAIGPSSDDEARAEIYDRIETLFRAQLKIELAKEENAEYRRESGRFNPGPLMLENITSFDDPGLSGQEGSRLSYFRFSRKLRPVSEKDAYPLIGTLSGWIRDRKVFALQMQIDDSDFMHTTATVPHALFLVNGKKFVVCRVDAYESYSFGVVEITEADAAFVASVEVGGC